MKEIKIINTTPDPWGALKKFTPARIALGSAGVSIPTNHVLNLRLAHAQARDAVYSELAIEHLQRSLTELSLPFYLVQSSAITRSVYLENPDSGRRLSEESRTFLTSLNTEPNDICFIIGDGLSAEAVNTHAIPALKEVLPLTAGLKISPVIIAGQARVALSDETGMLMKSKIAVMLIGERPGLSSPHSLGIYVTYNPQPGQTDERRNCISNIHSQGISYTEAAKTLMNLINCMMVQGISGVGLNPASLRTTPRQGGELE